MKLADLHVHSKYGFEERPLLVISRLEIGEILEKAKKLKLSAIAISDHDNLKTSFSAGKIAKDYGIVIIPAAEITTSDGHILAYGIKENIKPKMSATETIKEIHRQGGLAVAAHPFYPHGLSAFYSLKKRKYINLLPIDGIEVINCATGVSQKAKRVAKILNLAVVGGSDAHCLSAIGYGLTAFPEECKTVQDYLSAIKNRKTFAIKGKGAKLSVWAKTLIDGRFRPTLSKLNPF